MAAKYELKNGSTILKDGHVMFYEDAVKELNSKSQINLNDPGDEALQMCPLKFGRSVDTKCEEERCAWYSEDHLNCAVYEIQDWLSEINDCQK